MAVNRQYTAIFAVGAKLLGTFGASMSQAQARMRSLERTAQSVATNIKRIWATIGVSLVGYGIGKLFKVAFEGAFEAAADAQQKALSITNELFLHMRKQGYEAAEAQTKLLIAYNQQLAQTGVLGRGVFDAMTAGLVKIGSAPTEIKAIEPILAGVLVRYKGIRATAEDAAELADTFIKAAKGGRIQGMLKILQLGPSERARLKAYKDDWRGALSYLIYLASKYKDFNVLMKNTPLGQIQRMRNSFAALARDIGETMLPAQADMAAAWEKALPEIKPALIATMSELAHIMGLVAKNTGDFADRMAQSDAQDVAAKINKQFQEIWALFGFTPTEGSFGYLLASGLTAEARILSVLLQTEIDKLKAMKTILETVAHWMYLAFVHPLEVAIEDLKDFMSIATGGAIGVLMKHLTGKKPATAALPQGPVMPMPVPSPDISTIPPDIAKDPRLLKAYLKGFGPPIGGMTPDVRRNVEKAARARDLAAGARPSVPYNMPPPPPAGKAVLPFGGATGQVPSAPAMPTTRIWGQPAGVGGGMGSPGFIPPGATSPYGGGLPAGVSGGPAGGPIGGGAPSPIGPAGGAPLIGSLAAIRAKYADELKDPEVVRAMYQRMYQEVGAGTSPRALAAQQAFQEELFNRAASRGQSLAYAIHDPKYYPEPVFNKSVSAKTAEQYRRIQDQVEAGSNISGFATGNASGNVGFAGGPQTANFGERFGIEGPDMPWARRMMELAKQEQANQPPPLLASNSYQQGGIARTPQIATLAEKGPEMVLPMASASPLPSPPTSGQSSLSGLMTAVSPFAQFAKEAMQGRFYVPSWMIGGKGQWMQASLGASSGTYGEMSRLPFGEQFRYPALVGGLARAGKFIGESAANEYNMTHAPTIHIHGNADEEARAAMRIELEDATRKFIRQFKDSQRHERRLSYESGYG